MSYTPLPHHLQASLLFASKITDACAELTAVPREGRAAALRALLSQLAAEGVAEGAWLPTSSDELRNHAVQVSGCAVWLGLRLGLVRRCCLSQALLPH